MSAKDSIPVMAWIFGGGFIGDSLTTPLAISEKSLTVILLIGGSASSFNGSAIVAQSVERVRRQSLL